VRQELLEVLLDASLLVRLDARTAVLAADPAADGEDALEGRPVEVLDRERELLRRT